VPYSKEKILQNRISDFVQKQTLLFKFWDFIQKRLFHLEENNLQSEILKIWFNHKNREH